MPASPSISPSVAVKPSLTLKRRLNAPPEKIYAAWTKPEQIARWFGPQEITRVTAETDLRVGGRYRIVGHAAQEDHEVSGVYRELVPNQKLVFTWSWTSTPERVSVVTVTLKPDGAGTMLTLLHEQFFDEPARDRHQRGWSGALDKLERLFA
jgi:uncharacterized protein YndB with AHSA1/START domain